ncbi:hypothetical protein AB0886_20345 [Streptomyces sp. NPDC024062]|uniref:hypothetical protein n=1 Tax=unclassified Streptomyces TaxID=2593676 RepID=UPI0034498497
MRGGFLGLPMWWTTWTSSTSWRSDVADQLVHHDQQHGTSTTGDIPAGLEDGCTASERDAVRAYARREWITRQERWSGI